ncbi:putative phytanoyl-CoA dioxygenase [Colletotrichum sublineola]|uniref:Putative phytanoyl-CoA dioxygenase n=1 Tax=Colletotrichum sublineola TaxID=1173701 RepID=A0A066XGM0_COLSU|nr:putative phytanoyl-CoA dioxygenase [Colletotrichum sublineola]
MLSISTNYGPEVQRIPADSPMEDIIYLLKRDGGVFLKNLIPVADVEKAYEECRERLENDVEWNGSFFPSWKHEIRDKLLMLHFDLRADTAGISPTSSQPYLCQNPAMRIRPGGKAQPLHRDDYISHNYHQEIDCWNDVRDRNRETAVGLFVAGSKVTKENGGTQFIPRSHLW